MLGVLEVCCVRVPAGCIQDRWLLVAICHQGKSLPLSPPTCWTLICHLSWVICRPLGVFCCS